MTEATDIAESLATLARWRAGHQLGGRKTAAKHKAKADLWREPAETLARRTRARDRSISTARLAILIMDIAGAPNFGGTTAFIRGLERLADNPLPRSTRHPSERGRGPRVQRLAP